MASKKKNTTLSMEQRLKVLEDLKTLRASAVATKYNVVESTICRIKRNAPKIIEFADKSKLQKKRQRIRRALYEELEQRLLTWFIERRTPGAFISDTLLLKKAAELKDAMGSCSNFKVSAGWLAGFKRRHNIRLLRAYEKSASADEETASADEETTSADDESTNADEASANADEASANADEASATADEESASADEESASADEDAAKKFVDDFANLMEEEVIEDNIYNMDETGLSWRALPSNMLAEGTEKSIKGYRCRKERITVALCANASGTHKLMPLVINRFQNPRALKNYKNKLPVIFKSQANTSMTQSLFVDWYENDFKPSVRAHQARNSRVGIVILLLDNWEGHIVPTEMLHSDNFKILYLPPNTTSLVQPMNQGITAKLKTLYRHKVFRRAATHIGGVNEFHKRYTIKDCIQLLDESWTEVTADNIRNAWNKIIPQKVCMYQRAVQHDISLITGERFSEKDVTEFVSNCEEAESRRSIKEEDEDGHEGANEDIGEEHEIEEHEIEEQKVIVGQWDDNRRHELKFLFERLAQYVSGEIPIIQQIFQVFKNHFLGPNE